MISRSDDEWAALDREMRRRELVFVWRRRLLLSALLLMFFWLLMSRIVVGLGERHYTPWQEACSAAKEDMA